MSLSRFQEHLAVLDDDMQFPPVHEHEHGRDSSNTLSRQSSAALNTPACSSKHLKRSKRSASVSQSDVLLSLIGERIATSSSLEDEFDCIGKNVAAKLRKMTPGMEVIAEKLIHDVLYEGMTGTLRNTTRLIS